MRRLALVAGLALLAAGCGGGGGGSSSGGGNPVRQAAEKTSKVGSVEVDFGLAGKGVSGDGSGVFDTKSGDGQLTMSVSGQKIDTLVADNVLYLRSPVFKRFLSGDKEWVRVDLAEAGQQNNAGLGSLVDSNPTPTGALAYLKGAGEPKELGQEKVQGVDTTHYRTTVDLERAASAAKGSQRASIRRVIDVSNVRSLPMDVWVDGDSYVRKIVYVQHSGPQQSAKVSMRLHDFGAPVSIASPPSNQVVDFKDLITPQGG